MKKGFSITKKITIALLSSLIVLLTNCDSWMKSDDFFGIIDEEVKYANAEKISVFVRYANTKEGTTNIDGTTTQKVEVPFTVSAVTSDAYGFYKWAAFSTSDYSTGRQHAILFNDDADYIDSFLPKEISSSIVTFDDPYSPETTVTINSARNDIFIIPIVAERPKIATSLPASGASNVVKNMAIRVVFSKKMDETTLLDTDESGNVVLSDKIDIYRTYGDFDNITLKSIKDIFTNVSLGATGKTLTIRLSSGKTMPPNTSIRVIIDGEVKDAYGYEMGQESTILFTTGTASDSLSPTIQEIYGGFTDANSWGYNQNQVSEDTGYHVSSTDLDAFSTSDEDSIAAKILTHRTTGLVNLWVYALDITETNSTPTEADVYQITLTATSLTNSSGDASEGTTEKEFFAYETGGNSSDVAMHDNTHGCQIAYDVSSLPDGLIRIDVGVTDTIGNDSFTPVCVDNSKGNYYKSIYVIKDTTKPDAEANFEKLKSDSADAPYGWYNATTIGTMEIYEEDDNLIIDNGNTKLVSLPENMKWIFKIGGDSSWKPSTSDSGWKIIKGNRYRIEDASCDTDGPVDIQMRLMDDLGNISDAVHLESIMYDGTKPAIGTLAWTSDDELEGITQHNPLTTQTLSIPFTEVTSGVKFLELTSKKNGTTAAAKPLTGVTIALDGNVLAAGTDYTNDGNKITFTESKKSGTFTITGIKVTDATANTDGIYTIGVDLTDLALNKTATTSEISVSLDKTNPKVENVKIADLVERIVYNQSEKTYWISKEHFDTERNANKNKLEVTITENGSGIKKIELGGNAKVTSSSVIAIGTTEYAAGTDFEIDTESNAITLTNGYSPILRTDSGTLTFYITNVDFTNKNSTEGNTLNITLTDFVALEGNNAGKIKLESGSDITKVYVDSENPSVNLVTLTDRAQNTENNSVTSLYKKDAYTDERIVDISIKLTAESAANGAGVKAIKLTNATFGSETTATVDGNAFTAYEKDGDTVTFEKVFTGTEEIVFTNVTITGEENGTQTVGATAKDLIGWVSERTDDGICYDNVSPEIGTLSWTTARDNDAIVGITKETTLSTQVLHIPFTEATAGIKKLTVEVTKNGETTTSTPFASSSLIVKAGGSTVAKTVDATETNSIIFTTPVTTGEITIEYLKISDNNDEGSYTVKVKLLDAAENTAAESVSTIEIAKDSTAPVIEKVQVDNVRKRVLKSDSSTTYWLGKEAHNGTLDQTPAYACMDIYITEVSSGVQKITFGSDTVLQSSTKVFVDDTEISSSEYSISTSENNLTFTTTPATQTATRSVIMKKSEGMLKLRLENIKFKNSPTSTSTSQTLTSCKNTFSITAQDFALNKSQTKTAITIDDEISGGSNITADALYSYCYTNTAASISLVDRSSDDSTANRNTDALDGYTNEEYINLVVGTTKYSSGTGLPGVNKITISGYAEFVEGTTTIVYAKDASSLSSATWTTLDGSEYEFVDSTTCVFKKTFDSSSKWDIKFKDTKLTGSTNASKTVYANVHSVTGFCPTSSVSKSITYDTTNPWWSDAAGPYVSTSTANYSTANATSIHVYPHAKDSGEEGNGGIILDTTETNGAGNPIKYFYTSAYNSSSEYGMNLGIYANDNLSLYGNSSSGKITYYLYTHDASTSASTITSDYVIRNGTNPTTSTSTTNGSSYQNAVAWFAAGKTYSVVLKDAAGNISPVYTFTVVKDTGVVDKTTSGSTPSDSGTVNFESLFEYSVGEDGYQIVSYDTTSYQQNLYPATSDSSNTNKRAKITLNFNDGTTHSYSEAKTTKTQSGLYAYRFYASTSASLSDPSPVTSTSAYDTSCATSTSDSWHSFSSGSESIVVYPPISTSNYYYYLQLQDNVGNVYSFPIRQQTSKYELWTLDKDTINEFYENSLKTSDTEDYGLRLNNTCTGIHSFTGDQEDPHRNGLLGAMATTTDRTFYNDKASLRVFIDQFTAIKSNSKILSGSKKGTEPAYTYRAALISSTSETLPTKAQVDAKLGDTRWTLDDDTSYGWSYLTGNDSAPGDVGKYTVGDSIGNPVRDDSNRWQLKVKYPRDEEGETSQDKYMFLVIEDYTGQFGAYQIGNYSEMNKQQMKWRYDNDAPTIYLKGTTTEPSEIATEEGLNQLVSQAGKRIYLYNSSTAIVAGNTESIDDNAAYVVNGGSYYYKTGMGVNTFRSTSTSGTYGGITKPTYRPFFNIDVEDNINDLGSSNNNIYAYCYTFGTATPPDVSVITTNSSYMNRTDDIGDGTVNWYAGDGVKTNGVSAMFDEERLSISESDAKTVYLHVMDTIGNVRTMKMGNVKWYNSWKLPVIITAETEPILKAGEYYLQKERLDISGTGTMFTNQENLNVYIPTKWFTTEHMPSSSTTENKNIYGYSLPGANATSENPASDTSIKPGYVASVPEETLGTSTTGPYLSIPYSTYSKWTTDTTVEYNVYDKVGNFKTYTFTATIDKTAPMLKVNFKAASDSQVGKIYSKNTGYQDISLDTSSSSNLYTPNAKEFQTKASNSATEPGYSREYPWVIYSNARTSETATTGNIVATFQAADINGSSTAGLASLTIKQYAISASGTVGSELTGKRKEYTKEDLTETESGWFTVKDSSSSDSVTINLDESSAPGGKLFEISLSDYASNTTTVYLEVRTDRAAPAFGTSEPKAEKAAPNNVINEKDNKLYYNTMKIEFTPNDAGIGSASYEILGGTGGTTSIKSGTLTDGTKVSVSTDSNFSTDVLKVKVTDKLGNTATKNLYLDGTEVPTTKKWIRDTVKPTVSDFAKKSYKWGTVKLGFIDADTQTLYYNIINIFNYQINAKTWQFELIPRGTDSDSGIMGYYISKNASETTIASSSLEEKPNCTPSDYVGSGDSGKAYIYAVDYAGNISAAKTLNIAENNDKSDITINDSSYSSSYCEDGTICYFNDETTINATISDSKYKITEYGFMYTEKEEPGDDDWQAVAISSTEIAKNTPKNITAKLGDYIPKDKDVYYLYLYVTNEAQDTYKVIGQDDSKGYKWVYDNAPPTITATLLANSSFATSDAVVEADAEIASGATGYFTKDGYTLNFAIEDNAGGCGLGTVNDEEASATYTKASDADGKVTITAKDKLGNAATFTLEATVDKTGPDVSAMEITNTNKNPTEAILYIGNKDDTAEVSSVTANAEGVAKVEKYILTTAASGLDASSDWKDATELPLTDMKDKTSEEVYIASIDILGNISYKKLSEIALKYGSEESDTITGAYTLEKDETPPAAPTTISVTEREGMILKAEEGEQPVIYFSATVFGEEATNAGLEATIAQEETDSDLKGFKVGEDGTVGSTVTIPLTFEEDATTKEVAIYAVDFAGNVSDAFTVKVVNDSEGPAIGTYTGSASIEKANDRTEEKDYDYVSNVYDGDYTFSVPYTDATSNMIQWGYKITSDNLENHPNAPDTWIEISESPISLTLPEITEAHQHVFIYLKDAVGNVSWAALGDPSINEENWWIKYKAIDSASYNSSANADEDNAANNKTTVTISNLSPQSPVSSITLTQGSTTPALPPTVTSMKLNGTDYKAMPTVTATNNNGTITVSFGKPYIASEIVLTFAFKGSYQEQVQTGETNQDGSQATTTVTKYYPATNLTVTGINDMKGTGFTGVVQANTIGTRLIEGIDTLSTFFAQTSKNKPKKARQISFDEVFAKRYQTSSATSAVKTATNVVAKTADAVAKAAAIKNETVEAESGNEERTVDFSDYREEISRHIFAKAVSTGGKKISNAVQKKVEKRIEKEIDEIIKEEPKNSTSEKTMETVQKERKESLSAVQIQIAKIVLAMVLATVIVGIVFAIKKNGKPRNEN